VFNTQKKPCLTNCSKIITDLIQVKLLVASFCYFYVKYPKQKEIKEKKHQKGFEKKN